MSSKNCVLAFSGGLDTSAIVPWLIDHGYTVHAVLVDVGQDEDLPALADKALRLGAKTAVIRDAKPEMYARVIPLAIGLAATYEGNYRLGTALARPFIALAQVRRARELGGATLVHGATGKGNDQVRFEFAYRSLAPAYPVLAPWKIWQFQGRRDLIDYLQSKGITDTYEVEKTYSLDENLWHLSVEGGTLEDPAAELNADGILQAVAHRFALGMVPDNLPAAVRVQFAAGRPVAINGMKLGLQHIVDYLNRLYRYADWAWDLVLENRFTGIKSRGVYINPAAKLLHTAIDALARSCFNKPTYEQYVALGRDYGAMLYRGEYISTQRQVLEAAGGALMQGLNGTVTVRLAPQLYPSRIEAEAGMFRHDLATFEASDFSHQDAEGFIKLSWLTHVGRPQPEQAHEDIVETVDRAAPELHQDQPQPRRRLVPSSS